MDCERYSSPKYVNDCSKPEEFSGIIWISVYIHTYIPSLYIYVYHSMKGCKRSQVDGDAAMMGSIQGKKSASCPFAWFSSFFSRGVRKERDLGHRAGGWLVAGEIQGMIGPNDDDHWEEIAAVPINNWYSTKPLKLRIYAHK